MLDSTHVILGQEIFIPAQAKQLMLAAFIGFIIGVERAWRGKVASMRTFALLSTGSCLYTILSVDGVFGGGTSHHDITRVAAQIVTGVGFLGGGVIFKTRDRIEGVTTGALIWLTAAIGMACGFNQTALVVWVCLIGIVVHAMSRLVHAVFRHHRFRINKHW